MSTYEELLVELGDYGSPFAKSPPIVQLITLVMFNTAMFVAVHDRDINPFFIVLVGEPGGYMGHSGHTCVGCPCVFLYDPQKNPKNNSLINPLNPLVLTNITGLVRVRVRVRVLDSMSRSGTRKRYWIMCVPEILFDYTNQRVKNVADPRTITVEQIKVPAHMISIVFFHYAIQQ